MRGSILIVDDNKNVITALQMLIQTEFNKVYTLKNPNGLLSVIRNNDIDVVLLDMNFKAGINTGNEGLFWLKEIKKADSSVSVVMITAYGDIELAVRAVKEGAFDFVLKPWDNNKLLSTLNAALKLKRSRAENVALKRKAEFLKQEINATSSVFIGQSEPMQQVMAMIKKVAVTDANIFITGENGTGKELVAREIHNLSKRSKEMLVSVDMGAITETLFESELFGHIKGAFTDAKKDRIGKFELAHKGTIFLDEIGNLSPALQAKMLRAIQSRTITKVGSNKPVPVDIRLISATNKNIHKMVADGLFREDLLYRINTITIELPPLRERGNDILLIAGFYLNKYSIKYGKPQLIISDDAKEKLLSYKWPGNVRELQHCIEKAVILTDKTILDKNSFSLNNNSLNDNHNFAFQTIEEMEKKMIMVSIKEESGNMSRVAKKLGFTRQTLYNKLKKYNL